MQRYYLLLVIFLFFIRNGDNSSCNVTLHSTFLGSDLNSSNEDPSSRLPTYWVSKPQNNSFHLVLTSSSLSAQLLAIFASFKVSHMIICQSKLCGDSCDACGADFTSKPRMVRAAGLSILQVLQARSFVLFYDDTALNHEWDVIGFQTSTSKMNLAYSAIRIDLSNKSGIKRLSKALKFLLNNNIWHYRHFLVMCSEESLNALFDMSQASPNPGLLNRQFFWIILTPFSNTNRILKRLPLFANVLWMRAKQASCQTDLYNPESLLLLADQKCDELRERIRNCSAQTHDLNLYSLVSTDSINKWENVAMYSMMLTESLNETSLFPNTFEDFGGRTLVIASLPYEPMVIPTNRTFMIGNKKCHEFEGALIDVVNIMSQKLNFRTCFIYSLDGFGNYNETTDRATGLIRMVYEREVDLVVTGLTMSYSRSKVIDFSFPFTNMGSALLIRRETPKRTIFQILSPFSWRAWLAIVVAIFVPSLVCCLISKLSPFSGVNIQSAEAVSDEVQMRHVVWNSIGFFLGQGQDCYPMAYSSRLITFSLWIFGVIIVNVYAANLFIILAIPESRLPIRNLEDLSRQNEIRPLIQKGISIGTQFATSSDPIRQRLSKMMIEEARPFADLVEMVRTSKGGRYALLGDHGHLQVLENMDCGSLLLLPEIFDADFVLSLAWPKYSYYADKINGFIQSMVQGGIVVRQFDSWFEHSIGKTCPKFSAGAHAEFSEIEVSHLVGTFIVIGSLLLASASCLAAEKIRFKWKKR